MRISWLNIFFRFSGKVFRLKQNLINSTRWYIALYYALLLLFAELILTIVSFPLYFLVAPKNIQQGGRYSFSGPKTYVQEYVWRRKIAITTSFGAVAVLLIKIVLVGGLSFYLLGAQKLLAETRSWTFGTPTDYIYNTSTIEITDGVAQLKDVGSTVSGGTSNAGFDSGTTGWTYADWGQGGGEVNVAGARVTTGGNPGGWINISFPAGSGDELGGYWRQPFTTTAVNPSTTVSFNWQVTAFDNAPAPITFKLYVFVDTGTGIPVVGQEVWSSGEITGTSTWVSINNLDVSSKVTAVGTYYLKVAVWLETPGTATGPFTIGYDNILLNWSKTTHAFATSNPTTTPVSSLSAPQASSWSGFTETATKNGGEISYQLSGDDGVSWKYWDGNTWAAAGTSSYNTASLVNAHIAAFSTSTHQIKWRAFLTSDGIQQVKLSSVSIAYTQNDPPQIAGLTAAQDAGTGNVHIDYNLLDPNSDPQSLINFEYSLTGAFAGEQVTMAASTTDPAHSGIINLTSSPTGVAHTFSWDARSQLGSITTTVFVRLRTNDGIANSAFVTSSVFSVDYISPVVSNVTAAQTIGSTTVNISYDLYDSATSSLVWLEVSSDSGSTWIVPAASVVGDVGSGQTSGTGKTIIWDAGVDFSGHDLAVMRVRLRARDVWQNQGSFSSSANFSLDTLAPVVAVSADLQAQPHAGDSAVLVGGSFTETNPNTNDFYVALDGGDYGSATVGNPDTATPAPQSTAVGATLKGDNYISKVKIIHTDDSGQTVSNENNSPVSSFKYVKPYTPPAPVVDNPGEDQVDVTISKNADEASGLEYVILETSQNKYVQADGALSDVAVWRQIGTGAGQWGNGAGTDGKVMVTGLSSPVAQYSFAVKSRNSADLAHAAASESDLSPAAGISNTAASILILDAGQSTGNSYVLIHYIGTDIQNDANNLTVFEYSVDGTNWFPMTEKAGVGSSGTGPLSFSAGGTNFVFAWDITANLPDFESSVVRIRLKSNDGLLDSNLAESSAFVVDTKVPVISNISALQSAGSGIFNFSYDLVDNAAVSNTVQAQISDDNGVTWSIPVTSIAGDIGDNVSAGISKSITWNAVTDYPNAENNNFKIRIKATDRFGNAGSFVESALFTVDTKGPTVSSVTAMVSSTNKVVISYDLADITANGNAVEFHVSDDDGATWSVATATYSGDVGSGQITGAKTFIWDAPVDYAGHSSSQMKAQVRAVDYFGNVGSFASSASFTFDAAAPVISNLIATQITNSTNVRIDYDLADAQTTASVIAQISSDGGSTWDVATSTLAGDIGSSVSVASGRTITWNAGTDFGGQDLDTVRIRLKATDQYGNTSAFFESTDFSLNTLPPAVVPTSPPATQSTAGGAAIPITVTPPVKADTTAPDAPLVFSPSPDSVTGEANPIIIGGTEPGAVINIILDGANKFVAAADGNGTWQFILPSQFALQNGLHTFVLTSIDQSGNESSVTLFNITKTTVPEVPPVVAPVIGGAVGITPIITPSIVLQPTPPAALVQQGIALPEAISLPVPTISVAPHAVAGDSFVFFGTALPNHDVLVYLHSSQALVYRTHSDSNGNWQVTHSQQATELTPGDHSIFAVSLDSANKVKSRPSAVQTFTVKKNFWASLFTLLNIETTAIALAMLGFTMLWLYRLKSRVGVEV